MLAQFGQGSTSVECSSVRMHLGAEGSDLEMAETLAGDSHRTYALQ